ncbi:MAG: RnfABCDGE type electron transport complex subunit D [Oscillospiraceae bacterium]|nr:RnfABCDGE type electron transport complex subunit D [Oscillospiraceae bacterium]
MKRKRLRSLPRPKVGKIVSDLLSGGRNKVRGKMTDVLLALIPALGVATYFFGPRVLILAIMSMAASAFFEALYCNIVRRRQTWRDGSAMVTGLLLAMTLPASAPYWMVLLGDAFAILVVKNLYGGLGKNFLNPALAGRVFLFSFPVLMSRWTAAMQWPGLGSTADAVTSATPMAAMRAGALPTVTIRELLVGQRGGALGETAALMLLAGGLYLLLRKDIRLRIPASFLGTVAVLSLIWNKGNDPVQWMLYSLLTGGLLLGALFMATDPVTSPVTPGGQWLYGVGCGVMTVFLRNCGAWREGVGFAILFMNLCVWLLDKAARPGKGKGEIRLMDDGGEGARLDE